MILKYNKNIEIEPFSSIKDLSVKCIEIIKTGNIALSGGTTYLEILSNWGNYELDINNVNFYPVDERVVPFESNDSNWGNAYRVLFNKYYKTPNNHFTDANDYNQKLKNVKMDTIFLGVGDDGHTASLFHTETVLLDTDKKVIDTISPKKPFNRISLTGKYILEADNIIVVLYGKNKKEIAEGILNNKILPITTLLSKVKKGIIYIDEALLGELNE